MYRPAHELPKVILRGAAFDNLDDTGRVSAFLLDMNTVQGDGDRDVDRNSG